MALVAATAGGAMGWIMGGTTDAIREYDRKAESSVPETGSTTIVSDDAPSSAVDAAPTTTPPAAAFPADAWVPVHNAIQWATPVVAGQPLSGLSLRNGDQDVILVAHLATRAMNGAWMPVASMTVSPGREGILHPPPGDYSMTLVAAPVGMAFDRVASLPHSPATLFRMDPVASPSAIEPVRFSISKGVIKRLPSPTAARGRTGNRATEAKARTPDPETAERPSAPIMTITPPNSSTEKPPREEDEVWRDPPAEPQNRETDDATPA